MARAMTKTEFTYIRELIENYRGPRKHLRSSVAAKTGRSRSCIAYVQRAKSFAEYVKIRPEPHFKKPAAKVVGQAPMFPGAAVTKKVAPSNSHKAKSTAKAGKKTPASIVSGDELIKTLHENMAVASKLTDLENEQKQKLIQSNYVASNATRELTKTMRALNRDQWVRFVVLVLLVTVGLALVTMPAWK